MRTLLLISVLLQMICGPVVDWAQPVLVYNPPTDEQLRSARVVFWDLDHTLYSKGTGVYSDGLVLRYMIDHLRMDPARAKALFIEYDTEYKGQVLAGLMERHGVDPVQFEEWIDESANLHKALQPSQAISDTLRHNKARNWVFTNSGLGHAQRVIDALELAPLIEAVIFLDYANPGLPVLKPTLEAYQKAMEYAQVTDPDMCYMIDDIEANAQGACLAGWNAAHFCEPIYCIKSPRRRIFPRSYDKCGSLPSLEQIQGLGKVFPELT